MPVISRNIIYYENPTGEGGPLVKFTITVKYIIRAQHFRIDIPEWWHGVLGYKTVYGETQKAVNSAYKRAQAEFTDLSTNRKKVILYLFKGSAVVSYRDEEGNVGNVIFREKEVTFSKGTALDFWWVVGYECTSPYTKYKKYVVDPSYFEDYKKDYAIIDWGARYIGDNRLTKYNVMDYTEQRYEFFTQLQANIDNLIMKAHAFFNQDMKEVAKLIDIAGTFAALPDKTVSTRAEME